ncbi:MAG: hypothetical protein AAB217_00750 [Chloroflexota bacterium]
MSAQAEADAFDGAQVHAALEQYRAAHPGEVNSGSNATEQGAAMLAELVKARTLTPAQADAFMEIHHRLAAAGLMP